MTCGLPELDRLYLGDCAAPARLVQVGSPLSAEQFTPDTIFINRSGGRLLEGGLLELNAPDHKGATPGSCLLPPVPVYAHAGAVPAAFLELGVPAAFFRPAGAHGTAGIPAALEFPGNRFWFNFDPRQALRTIERELYFTKARPAYTKLPFNIQRVPPALRKLAAGFLKGGGSGPGSAVFPAYPKDFAAELLTNLLVRAVSLAAGAALRPAGWPGGKKYAFMLTHDVDSNWLYKKENLDLFLAAEDRAGVKGAWYFVNGLYRHDFAKIDRLAAAGHEIGLHGDNHDHKIAFLPEAEMRRRLDGCRRFIDRYAVKGFRSPHYLRTPGFYEVLKDYVRYDTSMHDSYNPANAVEQFREGCSAIHPFTLSDGADALLELPITIPEDYELYDPGRGAASIAGPQLAQVEEIKRRGGLATLVIHPEPAYSARRHCFEAFQEVLRAVSADKDCWVCRPADLCAYWVSGKIQ